MFYLIIKHFHSDLRWIIILLLLTVVIRSLVKLLESKAFGKFDRIIASVTMSSLHVQLILGLILYFISPKVIMNASSFSNPMLRFFLVEHIGMMIVSIAIVTLGYMLAKKALEDHSKHLRIFAFYLVGLIFILYAIPWPWQRFLAGWL